MIEVKIPGRGELQLEYLVCDVNGTLAVDGILPDGLSDSFSALRGRLDVHLLTADTHGRQNMIDRLLCVKAIRIKSGQEAQQKAESWPQMWLSLIFLLHLNSCISLCGSSLL